MPESALLLLERSVMLHVGSPASSATPERDEAIGNAEPERRAAFST